MKLKSNDIYRGERRMTSLCLWCDTRMTSLCLWCDTPSNGIGKCKKCGGTLFYDPKHIWAEETPNAEN